MTVTPDPQSVTNRPWEQPFSAVWKPEEALLVVAGAVEERDAVELRELIQTHSEGGTQRLVIDLSDVQLLPSSAVGVLAVAVTRSAAPIELVAATGSISQRVLRICGLAHSTGDVADEDASEAEPEAEPDA